jgi:hypothetical protein
MLHRLTAALVQALYVMLFRAYSPYRTKHALSHFRFGASYCALAATNLTLLSQYIACLHVAVAFAFGYGQYE